MQQTNPVEWFKSEITKRPVTAVVFYRGLWCPWCSGYMKELNKSFVKKIRAVGGELFAVTAQELVEGKAATQAWSLDFQTVVDPTNELAKYLKVNITDKKDTYFKDHPSWYPHGLAQPALIVMDQQGRTLFHWAIVPAEMNLGGASDRPLPDAVWSVVEQQLKHFNENSSRAQDLPKQDWQWLRENYNQEYETTATWFNAEVAAGKFQRDR
jgi:peroxiredoxin